MIKPQFNLYEDIEQKIEDRQKFSIIIINAIDAPKHAHISGQVEFTNMMHYLSLWVLAAGKDAMPGKWINAYEFGKARMALLCQGDTNSMIQKKLQSILKSGYLHTVGNTNYLINVECNIATFSGDKDKTVWKLMNDINFHEDLEGANVNIDSSHYLFSKYELLNAIETGQLELWYQIQVDLKTFKKVGVEALLRWEHPKYGLVPPDEMLCWFKFYSLQLALDKWVIATGFKKSQEWKLNGTPTRISINIDGLSLNKNCDFVQYIKKTAIEFDVDPSLIEIEITESIVIKKDSQIYHSLIEIASYGFNIAIDDFGTGTSNINYLTYLPVNTIKLDRFFCNGLHYHDLNLLLILKLLLTNSIPNESFKKILYKKRCDFKRNSLSHGKMSTSLSTLTKSTTKMLMGTNHNIVAEGIETYEQAIIMRSLGCHIGQGYFFGRPGRQ
ncbi:EAL domain-containing protein [Photobacterium toruni]|uniref:EAL domain-containing protein n=1 Tax=Photobacterium toruni TaxID=1935446 RepID=UPI00210FBD42|nr:EAL domain-containing protein [Photobacterium toruni]